MFHCWAKQSGHNNSGLAGLGALSLSINSANQLVGDVPTYVLTGGKPNQEIFWSSFKDGQSTGEVAASYGHHLDAAGNWAGQGSPWTDANAGRWQKLATAGGEQASTQFYVSKPQAAGNEPAKTSAGGGFLSGSINLFGMQVPTVALLGGAALWLMSRGGRR